MAKKKEELNPTTPDESLVSPTPTPTKDIQDIKAAEVDPSEASTQPIVKAMVQNGAVWFGYNKDGALLIRSKNKDAVAKAIKDFGGWDA